MNTNADTINELQTPRQLLPGFYQQYGLGDDGGQSSPHVKIAFTKKLFVYFPNSDARRKAVFKHDVHHLVTGYTSTFKGETEISAWEIGSGCKRYRAAFFIDLYGVMMGMTFNPAGVFRAFVKGRQTKNLYHDLFPDHVLMDMPVTEIKKHIFRVDNRRRNSAQVGDVLLFLLLLLAGLLYSFLSLVLFPFVLIYTIYVILNGKK